MRSIQTALRALLPLVGGVCVLFPEQVARVLPLLLGGAMLLTGLVRAALYLSRRPLPREAPPELGETLILLVMGTAFLWEGSDAIGVIGVTWGLLGLRKAAGVLNEALRRAFQREGSPLLPALEAVLRLALALALLFDPFAKFAPHIVLLGLELIVANLRLLTGPRTGGTNHA